MVLISSSSRHSPGRFFAVNELKVIVSHIINEYDLKAETEGVVPDPVWFGTTPVPDSKAVVYFRKRVRE